MPALTNVRGFIEALLSSLADGAAIGEGISLHVRPGTTVTLDRTTGEPAKATLAFDPPPEVALRRGPVRLRCTLRAVTIGAREVHVSLDGWFDRRWPVES